MTERKEDIRRLLDRYMAGDTSLEEEARLTAYFRSPDADKEFAAFREMFALFDQGEPSFPPQEMASWIGNGPDTPRMRRQQRPAPSRTRRRTARLAAGLSAAALAAVSFYLGRAVPAHETTSPTPAPPEVRTVTLTQVKWRTDTVYVEKPVAARPPAVAATRPVDSLPGASGNTDRDWTAASPPADTATEPSGEMPHLVDIQAEFEKQRKRMETLSEQYEFINPSYENIY